MTLASKSEGEGLVDEENKRENEEAGVDPWLERTLGGRYRIRRQLGRGMAGTVYQADPTNDGISESYAIKIVDLHNHAARRDARPLRQRIENEIRSLVSLSGAHVVRFYDYLELDERHVAIVTEYIGGTTLEAVLEREGALGLERSCEIARQIALGMHEAHLRGIIHRDLKPENVLMQSVGRGGDHARIIDFGISSIEQDVHVTTGFVGTPLYASPEQFLDDPVVAASDIYSLGVMLFEMLTGHPPFESLKIYNLMVQHLREEPPSLEGASGGQLFPDALEDLIGEMLRKDRLKRPRSMEEVAERLEAIVAEMRESEELERLETSLEIGERSGVFEIIASAPKLVATAREDRAVVVDERNALWLFRSTEEGRRLPRLLWRPRQRITALDIEGRRIALALASGDIVSILLDAEIDARVVTRMVGKRTVALAGDASGESFVAALDSGEVRMVQPSRHHQDRSTWRRVAQLDARPTAASMDAHGLDFAVASEDCRVRVFSSAHSEIMSLADIEVECPVLDIALSHDGHLLAVLLDDGVLHLFDPQSGLAVSRVETGGAPGSGAPARGVSFTERDEIICIAADPDGEQVVSWIVR